MNNQSIWKKKYFHNDFFTKLHLTDSRIITFVGAGGKTSLMNTLGKEAAFYGRKTLITTTTHIMRPAFLPDEAIVETEAIENLSAAFHVSNLAALGIPCQQKPFRKWQSPSLTFLEETLTLADVILCEGDGSKGLPVKIPRNGEPVFCPQTDTVIGVIGLSCLNQPISECMFGYDAEQFHQIQTASSDLLRRFPRLSDSSMNYATSLEKHTVMTPELLFAIALSDKGLRKNAHSKIFHVVFNQADLLSPLETEKLLYIAKIIRDNGVHCHIVSLKNNYLLE